MEVRKIRKRFVIPTAIVAIVTVSMLMSVGTAMAADTHVEWQGVDDLKVGVYSEYSFARLLGTNADSGQLTANTNNWGDRVQVDSLTAGYNDGGYDFTQYNNLGAGNSLFSGPESWTGVSVNSDDTGYIELRTEQSYSHNELGPVKGWEIASATGNDTEIDIYGQGNGVDELYASGDGTATVWDLGEDQPTIDVPYVGTPISDIEFVANWQ